MKIDLKKWQEDTVCPCCGGLNFSEEQDYQASEIFRDFTCSDCDSKWTERYNLTKVTSSGVADLEVLSKNEEALKKENESLKEIIEKMSQYLTTEGSTLFKKNKYPFVVNNIIDNNKLLEWAKDNMNYSDEVYVEVIRHKIVVTKNNGEIKYAYYKHWWDFEFKANPLNEVSLKTKKFDFFWLDPVHESDPDSNSSGLYEVATWPKDSLEFKCYSKLEYDDYDHNADDGKFGLELGYFDCENVCIDSYEETWFDTEEDREAYIAESNMMLNAEKIPEYVEDPKYYKDLRYYTEDAVFHIRNEDGSEAEVYKNELWQLVELDKLGSFFVKIEIINGDTVRVNMTPTLQGGLMSTCKADYIDVDLKYINIPLETLVKYAFLYENYDNGVSFDFQGNESIEGFYANIVSFEFDADNSIIATIQDMEGSHFDVSWEEIKDSQFDVQ